MIAPVRRTLITIATLGLGYAQAGEVVLDSFTPGNTIDDIALTLDGSNTFNIQEAFGIRAGSNLFHSFDAFNIDVGETAAFTGDATIGNIISRVTGGDLTTIAGTIRNEVQGAGWWLVNPAGVIVGETAQFDVSGTLAIGSADFVQFADGSLLSTNSDAAGVSLLVDSPVSFGWLANSNAQGLTVSGAQLVESDTVDFGAGVLLAGNTSLTVENSEIFTTDNATDAGAIILVANDGDLTITNTAVRTGVDGLSFDAAPSGVGQVTMIADGEANIDGLLVQIIHDDDDVAPVAQLTADDATIINSSIFTGAAGTGRGADFNMNIAGDLGMGNTGLAALTRSIAVAGDFNLTVGGDLLVVSSTLNGNTVDSGDGITGIGGFFNIDVAGDVAFDLVEVIIRTETTGDAGRLNLLSQGDIQITNSVLSGETVSDGIGGDFIVTARGTLSTFNTSLILNSSGNGDTGFVRLRGDVAANVTDTLIDARVFSGGSGQSVAIESEGDITARQLRLQLESQGTGSGSDLVIRTPGNVDVREALIVSNAEDTTRAGILDVDGNDIYFENVTVSARSSNDSTGSSVDLFATNDLTLQNVTIDVQNTDAAIGGPMSIQALGNLAVRNTLIDGLNTGSSEASRFFFGANGTMEVFSSRFELESFGAGRAAILEFSSAGDLSLTTNEFEGSTFGDGLGGSLLLRSAGNILIDDLLVQLTTESVGNGGLFRAVADEGIQTNNLRYSATNSGSGNAGDLEFTAGTDVTLTNSTVNLQSNLDGVAGDFDVLSNNGDIALDNVGIIATTSGAATGEALSIISTNGELNINQTTIDLQNSSANSGGAINMTGNTAVNITNSLFEAANNGAGQGGSYGFFSTNGLVNIDNNAINVTSAGDGTGGFVFIGANDAAINRLTFLADTTGSGNGGLFRILTTNDLTITNTLIESNSRGAGNASRFEAEVTGNAVFDNSIFRGRTFGEAFGAFFTLQAMGDVTVQNAEFELDAESTGSGGVMTIEARGNLAVDLSLFSGSNTSSGLGGDFIFQADGDLNYTNSELRVISTGAGRSGFSRLLANGAITIDQALFDGDVRSSGFGGGFLFGSDTSINAQNFTVRLASSGTGDAGTLTVQSLGDVTIQNLLFEGEATGPSIGGGLVITSPQQIAIDLANVTVEGFGPGSAGEVTMIGLGGLDIRNAVIRGDVDNGSSADFLFRTDGDLALTDSNVSVSTFANADGGDVTFESAGETQLLNTSIVGNSLGAGAGGDLFFFAMGGLTLDGSRLAASATSFGNAGSINVLSDAAVNLTNNSTLESSSAQSEGGNVLIITNDMNLQDSTVQTSVFADSGDGGGLTISSNSLRMQRSVILANAVAGRGGTIRIDVDQSERVFVDTESLINAESQTGIDGDIEITDPATEISAAITAQNARIAQEPQLSGDLCDAGTSAIRFVVLGQGGVRPAPDAYLINSFDDEAVVGVCQ